MSALAVTPRSRLRSGLTLSALERELAGVGARVIGDRSASVSDLRQDSRRVQPGELFAARSGRLRDGIEFANDAVRRGASAVMLERGAPWPELGVPILEVDDIRLAIALAAEAIHGHPSRELAVIGITGTNGKTTTSFLVQHALSGAGARTGRLGTLGFAFESERVDSALTTPEADEVSRYTALVRDRGGTHLVMEVSSHALSQARVEATSFSVAAFTNLTQDHLDFHGSLESYGNSKLRLFSELRPDSSVINVDDAFGAQFAGQVRGRVLRVSRGSQADVRPGEIVMDARGIRGTILLPSGPVPLSCRLVGEHNLDNVLLTLGIVEALGLDPAPAARALESAPGVPGRLERCDVPADDVVVLVDYAHTPDALSRALSAVRGLTSGEVVCVFGCGGDRDPDKRPKMGRAVAERADRAIVTNDNPRSETPAAIALAIEPGLAGIPYEIELDREKAIVLAISRAKPGDVVLIAGKGHEPYQIIGEERRNFDDRVQARRALALRRDGGRHGH